MSTDGKQYTVADLPVTYGDLCPLTSDLWYTDITIEAMLRLIINARKVSANYNVVSATNYRRWLVSTTDFYSSRTSYFASSPFISPAFLSSRTSFPLISHPEIYDDVFFSFQQMESGERTFESYKNKNPLLKSRCRYQVMPCCVNANHWVLMVADVCTKQIYVMDSLSTETTHRHLHHLFRKYNPEKTWSVQKMPEAQQHDGFSCGQFAVRHLDSFIVHHTHQSKTTNVMYPLAMTTLCTFGNDVSAYNLTLLDRLSENIKMVKDSGLKTVVNSKDSVRIVKPKSVDAAKTVVAQCQQNHYWDSPTPVASTASSDVIKSPVVAKERVTTPVIAKKQVTTPVVAKKQAKIVEKDDERVKVAERVDCAVKLKCLLHSTTS